MKDLSKDFAIIFGIREDEVPEKSSGIKIEKEFEETDKFQRDENKMKEFYNKIEKQLLEKTKEFNKNFGSIMKKEEFTDDKLIKVSFKDLEKTFNDIFGNKVSPQNKETEPTKEAQKQKQLKETDRTYKTVEEVNNELKQASVLENMRDIAKGCGSLLPVDPPESEKQEFKYKIEFKDGGEQIISHNLMFSLGKNQSTNIPAPNTLIWGVDNETGEMICLDSSSIQAIVKVG